MVAENAQASSDAPTQQIILGSKHKPVIKQDGLSFRDLDGDGKLSPFEDWRLPANRRSADLVTRMTLEEKAGALLHGTLPGNVGRFNGTDTAYDLAAVDKSLNSQHVTSYISRLNIAPQLLAEQNNAVQEVAEKSRLSIPVTISTDPRNHFQYVLGASEVGGGFSQWPELLGFAAIGDRDLVRRFADMARQEYRAVGIHMTLSPQADLATEPQWPRQAGTFGSDSALTSALAGGYVEGFQGGANGLTPNGVISVIKHFAGYGAQPDGWDGHNHYGRFADLDNTSFANHVAAFDGAFKVKVAGVMPAYPILRGVTVNGKPLEPVGAGYSKLLLTDVLRGQLGYKGIILSDWAITRDCTEECINPTAEKPQLPQYIATSWGVEHLSETERYALAMDAGMDQFGGVDDPKPILDAVAAGKLTEDRINASVARIMTSKFELGLFDNPYVDPAKAATILGNADFARVAADTQRRSQIELKRSAKVSASNLTGKKVYLYGVDAKAAEAAGLTVVSSPKQADFAIIRTETASEMLHPHHFFGQRQKEGRLDYRKGDAPYDEMLKAAKHVPVVVSIFLDRPAILTNIIGKVDGIIANFGASDDAVLDVVLGKAQAQGRLPFELPSSMQEVKLQKPGMPDDTKNPLFPRGWAAGDPVRY
ncbi:MAG: glycoside hydrolase family 3 protein [Sphingobium sp.]|nr:glycoside hydrolase family 3 protein [Sphingobium sp.]